MLCNYKGRVTYFDWNKFWLEDIKKSHWEDQNFQMNRLRDLYMYKVYVLLFHTVLVTLLFVPLLFSRLW
jgi:hypothetical protein